MRKIIFILAAMAVVASCSQSRKWTDKEREEVRELVRNHRDRVAIRHMEESNYQNLEQCVLTTIEETYPDYNQYNKLTGKNRYVECRDSFVSGLYDWSELRKSAAFVPCGTVAASRGFA